ncbi:alpha/beta hydrolase family protein [Maribellus mangrovi]|uniref:alpha/beta hydrolase family protein n=1 Tax=Maribellus mangrovi TaxID=3133146 RepID=UPI0030EC190A
MNTYLRRFYYFLAFVIAFASCDEFEDVPPQSDDEYLVQHTKIESSSRSALEIQTLITLASLQYPDLAEIKDKFTSGVDVYKITYNTTFEGEDRLASGLLCLPTESGSYPIMSFQNGTNTLHDAAPSEDLENNFFQLLETMASTGFVVAIPDYLGFGEADDMFHPYLHKESTVQSVLDMLRAAKEMLDKQEDLEFNNDLYITGYSQGGWTTMALQRAIETNYSNEFTLKASACGGGPHNLIAFTDYLVSEETYPMPYFLAYLFNSYMNLGMTTPIDSIFQQPYADRIPDLFDGNNSGADINNQLNTNVSDLFQPGFIENWNKGGIYESLYSMLEANTNSGYSTAVPTLLIHGEVDTYVPSFLSENLYQEFISEGVNPKQVGLSLLQGLDHTSAIIPAELSSIMWFIDLKEGN